MRTVELKDGKFYLNGRSVFQRLVLDQGYYSDGIMTAPTEQALIRDIQCALEAGFNGARLHMKIFEPRYLYHADKMGYLVWREYGNSGLDYSDLSNLADLLPEWLNSVKRDINHPCVVTWCPLNETWDYGELKKRADPRFAATMYNETKRLDPSRPCIDTSGLYHVTTDIYDVHDYEGDTDAFAEKYEKFKIEGILTEPENRKGRQKYGGEPFAVSEFGGIGYRLENNAFYSGRRGDWCHSDPTFTEEEFCKRYRAFVEPMLKNPKIFCFCYTQLTDVEQEKNGLYTYADRSPKIDMSKIAEINSQKAAVEE
jgi:beta-galactosidase/beta-glucuronidase